MKKPVTARVILYPVFFFLIIFTVKCMPVKAYQKVYLNDDEMNLTNRKIEIFESNFHSYREGAVGGNNGNSGSGCGCN